MPLNKFVYSFKEGSGSMRDILGGKGANLCEMTNLGLPIPQGFIVTSEACNHYNKNGRILIDGIKTEIETHLSALEKSTNKIFGGTSGTPLLVSVRSGSRASMPGMMDTILNLGLNDDVVKALGNATNNPRFAYDSYRRFILMFANIAIGLDKHIFEEAFNKYKVRVKVKLDTDLAAQQLAEVVEIYKELYKKHAGKNFPTDVKEQLYEAITAVFRSWDNERAVFYRRMHNIPYEWGTAVNIQSMVFGNFDEQSGTGVVFSRNPSTGQRAVFGEFLMNAQGEDVVAGLKTPMPFMQLKDILPKVYDQFMQIADKLERHYKDMQDMEFTIESGKLYFLQTRNGKRTAAAGLRIAIDLVEEGLINRNEALLMFNPKQLDALLHPVFCPLALKSVTKMTKGLPASPGAGSGKIYFTSKDAEKAHEKGEKVILVRNETSPDDIGGMHISQGILTAKGGMTSHAAVVARGMGRCCVCGVEEIVINEKAKTFSLRGKVYKEGDVISLDGSTGTVYEGNVKTMPSQISGEFATFMQWADSVRTLKIRANADTPHDAAKAIEFGAEGIGLVRSEHMFFEKERIPKVQRLILSKTKEEREAVCNELVEYQRADYIGIFEVMAQRPVTVRLLDPPLHEFLPKTDEEFKLVATQILKQERVAKPTPVQINKKITELKERAISLHEVNPMMGHRGCRVAVSYPEIAAMQTRAIIEALIHCKQKGINCIGEIMVPLIGELKEMIFVKEIVTKTANEVLNKNKYINALDFNTWGEASHTSDSINFTIGTMIEVPRAALLADEIAKEAEFFSFGTNDLTQLTYGISRDDAGRVLADYLTNNIYPADPFASLDTSGVGSLMKTAIQLGRKTNPDLKIGICGEHGGDPGSIEFCHNAGLNYVSCSPYRVPIARLSAAQAALKSSKRTF